MLQFLWTVLAAFDLAHLILWANLKTFKDRAAIPSAALSLVGVLLLALLSYFEHTHTIRPSFLLNVYLLFSVLFDIARSRSYALDPDLDLISTLFASRVGVKLILGILEAQGKRKLLLAKFTDSPPEATSGAYNRAVFWWLNALLKKGFSTSLTVDDLFHLDKHLQSDYVHHALETAWHRCKSSPPFWSCARGLIRFNSISEFHRPARAVCGDREEAQVAHIGGGATPALLDRF